MSKIQKEIDSSYNEFKKTKYILQSILIHDGWADGGHYYGFIFDFQTN